MKQLTIALICGAALAWPLSTEAAGGGGGGGGSDSDSTMGVRNQDPEYTAGMAAVSRKDWPQVVESMGAYVKRKPDDADGWNQLGHAYRQSGRMDPALDAYGKALAINPNHRGVREYLGEAYLQMGDLGRAEQELKVLDRLCLFSCEEYRDLKRSIGEYKKKSGVAGSAR
jgi:predicted Zn-dependent protease